MSGHGSADAGRGVPVALGTDPAPRSGFTPFDAHEPSEATVPGRVLVLGSTGYPRAADSYAWTELPDGLNVADYDLVVLDLTPLADEDYRQQVDEQRLPSWEQWARAMFAPTGIIAIGEPWLRFGETRDAYYWLPYRPEHTAERGRERVEPDDEAVSGYFRGVPEWSYYWEPRAGWHNCDEGRFLGAVHPALQHCELRAERLAETRAHKGLAVRLMFAASIVGGRAPQGQVFTGDIPSRSGDIILLPPATAWTRHEAVSYWLGQFGIAAEHEPPPWAAAFVLPEELPLRAQEAELRARLAETERALAELADRQADAGRWRALLYETGDALEVVVRGALAALGATVTEPAVAGYEDGRLTDPSGREAVLEVKGVGKAIKRDHVRQLHQWVADVLANEDRETKGLLVANAWAELAPGERPELVAADTLRLAERWEQALLTTTQLFAALVADQQGTLDREAFWAALFATNGLVALPELVGTEQ